MAGPLIAGIDLNPIDWLSILRYPIGWMIEELSKAFNGVGVLRAIGPFGLAVVVTTLIIRALVFPIMGWNLRTQRRIQREQRQVAPQLNEIRKRYKGQTRKISEESQRVYAEHGISPFSSMSGCVPLLVQMPVLYGLYWGIRDVIGMDKKSVSFDILPSSIHLGFLWIQNVAQTIAYAVGAANSPSTGCALANSAGVALKCDTDWSRMFSSPALLALLIFPVLTGLAYFVQSKMTMQPMRPDMSDMERQMASSMRMVVYFMPLMSLVFGFIWPQALTLYWMTAALVMVGQQYSLMGWGGLRVPAWLPGAGRTTPLSYSRSDLDASRAAGPPRGSGPSGGSTRSGRGPSPLPETGPPASPGRGRTPSRAQKKARRRRR
ncbi:MAG: membrane protein insertase YidC [Candidatus Dormibacteria bacterium]|jgi:YidC/Oxa1 family membrane protein insertase